MALEMKEFARKSMKWSTSSILGPDVDEEEFEYLLVDNSIDLHRCIMKIHKFDKLNDFLEFYLKTCDNIDKIDCYSMSPCYGMSPLHVACHYTIYPHIVKTVEILISAGANVNLQNKRGSTPLHIVANYDPHRTNYAKKIIKLLILAGADVFSLKDKNNNTVYDYLYFASSKDDGKLMKYLQIDKATQTIGIKTGRLTKAAKK